MMLTQEELRLHQERELALAKAREEFSQRYVIRRDYNPQPTVPANSFSVGNCHNCGAPPALGNPSCLYCGSIVAQQARAP